MPYSRDGSTINGADPVEVRLVECKSAISPSRLPGLDWAVNPYRGCGHACAYCYAQDVTRFEMARPWGYVIEVKTNIVSRLKKDLERKLRGVIGIGTVTDPYQPLESEYELTRGCLVVLKSKGARISVLTKSDLVLRDLDILAGWPDAEVGISIGCSDEHIASIVEPGAPSPDRRFLALRNLNDKHVNTYLMAAPLIPGLSDSEEGLIELVRKAKNSGVRRIIWDRFNPRPLATSRLRKCTSQLGAQSLRPQTEIDSSRTRFVLDRECARSEIELLDAF
jgi:DNA repair photolyase